MVNSNPETVSTDYDTSTRLYFEPLSAEHVLEVIRREDPEGVILQFGGQSPLKLARELEAAGARILGTSPDAIDLAEDRSRFGQLLTELGIPHPRFGTASTPQEAREVARELGYPVVVRPSYVLGGRRMEIVYDTEDLDLYLRTSADTSAGHPTLIDKFMEDYVEVDVDAVSDGEDVYIGGIMEHVEEAGVHSGDSSCVTPPITIHRALLDKIEEYTRRLALAVGVVGLMNVQFVVRGEDVLVIECNPRASRTVPFISKATGVPLAKVATRVLAGREAAGHAASGVAQRALLRQGAGLPLRPVRGRGPLARARDALYGRGHGHRPDLRRAPSPRRSRRRGRRSRRRAGCTSRWRTGTSGRWS